MSKPFIVVSTMRIKQGKHEQYKQFILELLKVFEEQEPQIISFNVFFNEDGTEMTGIQLHPNAASMDFHLQVLGQARLELAEKYGDVFDYIEPKSIGYYGTPSASALESISQFPAFGATIDLKSVHVAGFTRSAAG